MIGNIAKVVFTVILGLIVGLISGTILGFLLGFVISSIFGEIIIRGGTALLGILLALIFGSVLGFVARQFTNRFFGLHESPFKGAAIGAAIGLVYTFFFYGFLNLSDPSQVEGFLNGVAIFYSVRMGGRIGAVVFAILGAIAVIRERQITNAKLKESMSHAHEPSIYTIKMSSKDK